MEIFLKTEDEIELMFKANRLVSKTLAELAKNVKPGVTTLQLDRIAEEFIRDNGAIPTFKNFPNPFGDPFPASICTSVNDVVVHGIPDDKTILKDGDIISIDCGTLLDGYNGDSCYTFCVGEVSPEIKRLLKTTKESLYIGIRNAVSSRPINGIGQSIQRYCEKQGYGVVRELTGHGIGKEMHEAPQVPNYDTGNSSVIMKAGMCIAIEPMITAGDRHIVLMPDRWTIKTRDGKPAAHFEHTIAIREGEAKILSTFEEIEQLEGTLY